MPASIDEQIRKAVMDYIAGRKSLRRFQEWFARKTWNLQADPDLIQMVNQIELRLAEFSNGHWSEEELREKLQPYAAVVAIPEALRWHEVRAPYLYVIASGTSGAVDASTSEVPWMPEALPVG